MKYPSVILKGEFSKGEVLSIALANDDQHQDTGSKMIHLANNTRSNVISKSINLGSGKTTYRGLIKFNNKLSNCKNNTECDALLLSNLSKTDTYPTIISRGNLNNILQHEARVSKINEVQLFYAMQRNLPKSQATSLIVNGFINNLIVEFPIEYSIELKRLIELELEGSVG
jgi:Fe-S cluster assembly protein SufB